ncbi:hypothetical protein D1872_260410 [compost metagenome]
MTFGKGTVTYSLPILSISSFKPSPVFGFSTIFFSKAGLTYFGPKSRSDCSQYQASALVPLGGSIKVYVPSSFFLMTVSIAPQKF